MNLCTSLFVYIGSIGLYKRIVNADTQSIRIANADGHSGQGLKLFVCVFIRTPRSFAFVTRSIEYKHL